jgi:hypothetical protein
MLRSLGVGRLISQELVGRIDAVFDVFIVMASARLGIAFKKYVALDTQLYLDEC